VGLILVADPSVRVIYQTGAFGDLAVQRTVLCTQLLALGLLPLAVGRLLVRAVHAGGDAAAPLRLAGAVLLVQLVLGLALVVSPLAEAGLALAGALSNVAMMTGAIWLVRRRGGVGLIPWRVLAGLVVAAGVMTIAVLMAQAGLRRASADAFLGLHVWSPWWLNFAELVVSLVAGGGSYLLVTRLLSVRRKSAIQDRP
jgi:putative peptidoglycan lipid II flippase